jgi:hypothetical protein
MLILIYSLPFNLKFCLMRIFLIKKAIEDGENGLLGNIY